MSWRIEQTRTGGAHCDECEKPIARDAHRFGQERRWYHLACAAAGAPRAFKPFAEEAAALIASAPARRAKPKPVVAAAAHDSEIAARLIANPEDAAMRAVFADWLQSKGDPWGELIAFHDAGKPAEAERVLKQHRETLTGGLGGHLFAWKDGFIDHVSAGTGRPDKMIKLVEQIFALPTAMLTRKLLFGIALDSRRAARLSACAPRTLRDLFCWLSPGVSELAIPSLVTLRLYHTSTVKVDAGDLRGLFDATHLPNLRELELLNRLEPAIVKALAGSTLLRQLRRLDMSQDCLDDAGARIVLADPGAFQHLEELGTSLPYHEKFAELFPHQHAAFVERKRTVRASSDE